LKNLQRIKDFYDHGGVVIATSTLPDHSAELGKDEEVKQIIQEMFGKEAYATKDLTTVSSSSNWNTGGFIPSYAVDNRLETSWKPSQGNLKNEWFEISFGGERTISQVKVSGKEDITFSFKVLYHNNNEWIEGARWNGPGKVKTVSLGSVAASGIRIVLDSGAVDKIMIPEVEIMDQQNRIISSAGKPYTLNTNKKGGKAYFLPVPNSVFLKTILDDTGIAWDVRFEKDYPVSGGNLTYLHRRLNGQDIYFFANSSENSIDVPVILKGKFKLQVWNPHNGQIAECETKAEVREGINYTIVQLKLDPVESVFILPE
jgi:hypothetical protein